MRTLPLLVLFLLPACAPTTNELFMKANSSGDWTAVNARLEADDESSPTNCRDGSVLVCKNSRVETCTCELKVQFYDRQRDLRIRRGNRQH
jgi:hypothetical protein